jgi:hypothetical protein
MSRPEAWPDEFAGESAHGQEDGAHQQRQRRHLPDFAAAEAAPRQRASYHVVRARQDGHQGAPFMRGLRTVRTALSGQIWALPLQVNFFSRSVLKKNTYAPAWCEVRRNHPWLVTAQCMADLGIQGVERHVGICVAGQH